MIYYLGIFGKKSEDSNQSQHQEDRKQAAPQAQQVDNMPQIPNQKNEMQISQIVENPIPKSDLNTSQQSISKPSDSQMMNQMLSQPQNKDDGSTDYNPPSIFQGLSFKSQANAPVQSQQMAFNLSGTQSNTNSLNKAPLDLFGGLSLNQPSTQPQQQQQQSFNPLFAGLTQKSSVPQQQSSNPMDIFSQLNMKPTSQALGNPYAKQSIGEFAPPQFLQGPAFQTPQQLMETTLQSSKQYAKDDPFQGLTFNTQPTLSSTNPTNNQSSQLQQQNTSNSSGSMFQFLNNASSANNQEKKNQMNSDQKDIGDISMSSINNVSKNSFEEVDKNENMPSFNSKTQNTGAQNSSTAQVFQSVGGTSDTPFYFLKAAPVGQSSMQQISQNQVNTSVGNFELDKDPKDDNFEEITESKDIIEDRINRIKSAMIDFTMKQQDLSEKISNLQKDIELLQLKLEDTTNMQQRAIENEDYEEADQLNLRITQTKNLIQSKESQIKRLDEDYMALENKKSDKFRELSTLIHKSLDKMGELKEKQVDEMQQFEESEMNAIEEKRKRLHYESIRIEEIKKEITQQRDKVNQKLLEIEEQVYEDTRPQQLEKQTVESKIESIDQEIAEIEQLLERKRRERDQLMIEKQSHEKEIDKSRAKFRDQISKLEKQLEKIGKDLDKNNKDSEEQKRELYDLQEYEETYKTRLEGFQKELKELEEFEKQLKKNAELIDGTLSEKESCKDKSFMIKQEINAVKIKRDNAIANKEYIGEKLSKVDAEVEELQQAINNFEKKITKLEQEKKKAAAAKKFKEASKAQAEIKEFQTQMDESQSRLQEQQKEKDSIEKEVAKKDDEIAQYEAQLKSDQIKYEREQLKLLTYRKDDILDLLQSLKNMANVSNQKKKAESLQNELMKIDNELFELEKKYGEFKIRKGSINVYPQSSESHQKESSHSHSNEQIASDMPEVESSRIAPPEQKSLIIDSAQNLSEQLEEKQVPSRTKAQVRQDIEQLEDQVRDLESQIDAAAEAEDYEKADQLQTEIDEIQNNQIPKLRDELQIAIDEDDFVQEQIGSQEDEAYNPPSLGLNFDESPKKEETLEEVQEDVQQPELVIDEKDKVEDEEDNKQYEEKDLKEEQNEDLLEQNSNQQEDQNNEEQEEQKEDENKEAEEEQNKEEESSYSPPDLFAGMSLKS